MKMMYNKTPVKSMKVKHYEISTNDCSAIPSDLQTGVTCVSKGKKITGTGKSFEFAHYGTTRLNLPIPVPEAINVIEIASTEYPVRMLFGVNNIKNIDFSSESAVANVTIDGEEYIVSLTMNNNILTISCEKSISLEIFYGKDNYV